MPTKRTCGLFGADEDVGGLGQPLHELSDALRVVLRLAQRAHQRAQDATDDAGEQLRVDGLGRACSRVGSRGGPCSGGCGGSRGGRGEDRLEGHRNTDDLSREESPSSFLCCFHAANTHLLHELTHALEEGGDSGRGHGYGGGSATGTA